jgi:orotate phosphoribosyltransferase-like protein
MKADINNSSADFNNNSFESEIEPGPPSEPEGLKKAKHLIELRRSKVLELWSQGLSQQRIAEELHVSQPLISLDIQWIRETSREQIKQFLTEKLPVTVTKAFAALDLISARAWDTANTTRDEKVRIQALSLVKETEKDKIDIVSNVDVVDKIISITEAKKEQEQTGGISSAEQAQTDEEEPAEAVVEDGNE